MVALFLLNPLVPDDSYTELHGVKFISPQEAAFALASYGHFCSDLIGFFPATA
jgi:hypothetical protein